MTATATAVALSPRALESTNSICVTEVARRLETPQGARHLLPYYLNNLLIEGTEIDFKEFFRKHRREPSCTMPSGQGIPSDDDRAGLESYDSTPCDGRFLTVDKEREIGQVLEIARCRYRQAILQSPFMVKKAVETLEEVAAETLDPWWAQRRYDAPELSSEGFISAAQRNLPALRLLLEGIETAVLQEPNPGSGSIRVQHFLGEIFILLEETPLRFERFAPNCLKDIQEQTKRGEATFGMSLPQSSAYLTMVEGRGRELDGARELLTNPNLPIVIERAKAFSGRGIEFADLVGAGNIGLIDAANRFDWRRGNRFITPAVPWIDRCMRDEIYDKPNPCRPPRKQILAEPRRRNRLGELAHKLGRAPSQQEAESADIPTKPCHPAVRRLQDRSPSGGLIQNLLEDRSEPGDLSEEAAIAKKAISQLPTREQNIFYDRLEGKTLEEIGKALKITKERVRQIESRILKKLRKQLSHLQPFTR